MQTKRSSQVSLEYEQALVYMYAGLAEFENPDLIDYDLPDTSTIGELVERMKEINQLHK